MPHKTISKELFNQSMAEES